MLSEVCHNTREASFTQWWGEQAPTTKIIGSVAIISLVASAIFLGYSHFSGLGISASFSALGNHVSAGLTTLSNTISAETAFKVALTLLGFAVLGAYVSKCYKKPAQEKIPPKNEATDESNKRFSVTRSFAEAFDFANAEQMLEVFASRVQLSASQEVEGDGEVESGGESSLYYEELPAEEEEV